jgi:serine/threonine protein kinase
VFSSVETPTSIIIFEPLLCGGDLHNFIFYMHTEGLDEFTAKFVIYQILQAVAYLHFHGIAHRDLKVPPLHPHNETDCSWRTFSFNVQ